MKALTDSGAASITAKMSFQARAINKAREIGFGPLVLLLVAVLCGLKGPIFFGLLVLLCWNCVVRDAFHAVGSTVRGLRQHGPSRSAPSAPQTVSEYRAWLLRCTHAPLPPADSPLEVYEKLYREHGGRPTPDAKAAPTPTDTADAPPVFVDGSGAVASKLLPPPSSLRLAALVAAAWSATVLSALVPPAACGLGFSWQLSPLGVALLDPRTAAQALGGGLGAWAVFDRHPRSVPLRAAVVAAGVAAIAAALHVRALLTLVGPFLFTASPRLYHSLAGTAVPVAIRYSLLPATAAVAACSATARRAPASRRRRGPVRYALLAAAAAAVAVGAAAGRLPLVDGLRSASVKAGAGDFSGAREELCGGVLRSTGLPRLWFCGGGGGLLHPDSDPSSAAREARLLLGLSSGSAQAREGRVLRGASLHASRCE